MMILGPGVEYTPVHRAPWGVVPDPQAAFTLRSVLAAHQAARQHLDRLRRQQVRDVQAAADIGLVGGQLGNAARVELTRAEIERAQAREAEVREELAEAHARATGQPVPGSRDARRTELASAQQAERQARERFETLRTRPRNLRGACARLVRLYATLVAALGIAVAVTSALDWWVASVVCAVLLAAPVLLAVLRVCRIAELIAEARAQLPAASADHDVALRRLVAAEAAAVAAGLDIIPSTLDADVEAAAARPVPLAWNT